MNAIGAHACAYGIAMLAVLSACGRGVAVTSDGGTVEVLRDGKARVVGTVVANERGCETDGACRLVLDAGGRRVTVVYHGGEAPPCVNRLAAREGLTMQIRDRAEAFGASADSGSTISTCADSSYYLRRATPSPSR